MVLIAFIFFCDSIAAGAKGITGRGGRGRRHKHFALFRWQWVWTDKQYIVPQDGGVFYIITIRQEQPSDYKEVHNLVTQAFATTVYGDGTEADYLDNLRKKNTFIPELSLVAENHNGCIVGQIVMYRTLIQTEHGPVEALVLSPISVHPDYFRKGIARALIKNAVDLATCMGFIAVFLCGEPEIYTNLGFRPTYEFGITHISDSSAQWCMGMELSLGSLAGVTGTLDIV